jgi:hypothetical protein
MITIPEETTERLAQLMIQHELEMTSEAIEYAVDNTLINNRLSDAGLAHLLYQRLRSSDTLS